MGDGEFELMVCDGVEMGFEVVDGLRGGYVRGYGIYRVKKIIVWMFWEWKGKVKKC